MMPFEHLSVWRERAVEAFADLFGIKVLPDPLQYAADESAVTLAVPGYRQCHSYTCGFAAGLMVLWTFWPRANMDRFFRWVAPVRSNGTPDGRLVAALRRSRIGVSIRKNLTFAKVCQAIDRGYPIITTVATTDPEIDHWVVVYGYGRRPNRVFVAGNGGVPLLTSRTFEWSSFRGIWSPPGAGLVCWGR